jgi:PcfJ-like protein
VSRMGLSVHKKQQTSCAISAAYARCPSARVRATFETLFRYIHPRAPAILTDAPIRRGSEEGGRHLGVEALANLAWVGRSYVREPATWAGSDGSWQAAISSLARHLIGRYRVPVFLGSAWYACGEPYAAAKRRWFIRHAAGVRFRSLDLPMDMTRRMEHIFLASPEHCGIDYAMRRAELIALEAPAALVDAVLETPMASDLTNGAFWRSAWLFMINGWSELSADDVGPLIDFFQAIRHERITVQTERGRVPRCPPQPDFSLTGRTPHSVLRLMEAWHRDVGSQVGGLSWDRLRLQPMIVEVPSPDPTRPPTVWALTELTTSAQLRAESQALRHCVGSYDLRCWRGVSSIWSLRVTTGARVRPIATIEVDPRRHAIVQVRGYWNRSVSGRPRLLLQQWAAREQVRLLA